MSNGQGAFDIEAEIVFRTLDEGGRRTPIDGSVDWRYRPNNDFGVGDFTHDGAYSFVAKKTIAPGDTVRVRIRLVHPESVAGHLGIGQPFTVREGRKVVATGTILALAGLLKSDSGGDR